MIGNGKMDAMNYSMTICPRYVPPNRSLDRVNHATVIVQQAVFLGWISIADL
jgi:hypothetical protein